MLKVISDLEQLLRLLSIRFAGCRRYGRRILQGTSLCLTRWLTSASKVFSLWKLPKEWILIKLKFKSGSLRSFRGTWTVTTYILISFKLRMRLKDPHQSIFEHTKTIQVKKQLNWLLIHQEQARYQASQTSKSKSWKIRRAAASPITWKNPYPYKMRMTRPSNPWKETSWHTSTSSPAAATPASRSFLKTWKTTKSAPQTTTFRWLPSKNPVTTPNSKSTKNSNKSWTSQTRPLRSPSNQWSAPSCNKKSRLSATTYYPRTPAICCISKTRLHSSKTTISPPRAASLPSAKSRRMRIGYKGWRYS